MVSSIKAALEDKKYFDKDEAILRMVALGIAMKVEKGSQYYCYRGGVFFVSERYDFKESREWNPNDSSAIPNWINV